MSQKDSSTQEIRATAEELEPEPPLPDRTSNQPPEIITEIFKSISGDTVLLPLRIRQGPWVLGHVCSRWRKILWSSSSIWSNIAIESQFHNSRDTSRNRERAIRDPLRFIIFTTTFPLSLVVGSSNANICFDIVLPCMDRFRNLSLNYIPPEAFVSLLSLPPDSFSLLETFSVMTFKRDHIPLPTTSPLETAPNLCSVKFWIMGLGYIPHCLLLPLENMTDIRIQNMAIPLNILQRVLLSSPCLVDCSVNVGVVEGPISTRQGILPNLKALSLEASGRIDWPTFLDSLVVPALEGFSILSTQLPLNPINSLLTRSNCPLQHLSLMLIAQYVDSTDPGGVETLLGLIPPSIVLLSLSWTVSGSIFRRMQHGLLPKLEAIHLHIDADGLEAFARLRDLYSRGPRGEAWSLRRAEICYWAETGVVKGCADRMQPSRKFKGLEIAVFDSRSGLDVMDDFGMEDMDEDGSDDGGHYGEVI